MLEFIPWLIAMVGLICCSAFFSASEAALFSLRPADRRVLAGGTTAQRAADDLLRDPERVLSAVLFWNLVVNIAYFALASIIERQLPDGSRFVWPLRIGALLLIIFFSEMLPKTVAVLMSRRLAAAFSLPLSIAVRVVDPLMPTLRFIMLASRRLVWPGFEAEESLAATDLNRAIELSTTDAKLLEEEQTVLRNVVSLSRLRADQAMRPTTQLQLFRPPVTLEDLEGSMTPSGYLFLTDGESDNIVKAVRLDSLWSMNPDHLGSAADSVVYVPWCVSLADAAGQLLARDREVAVVVNEWGETVGAFTMDDVMDVLFTNKPSRSQRLLNREPITVIEEGLWRATGLTNLGRLAEFFETELPETRNQTISGVIQEELQRIPEPGDRCRWGQFTFEVLEVSDEGQFSLNIERHREGDAT